MKRVALFLFMVFLVFNVSAAKPSKKGIPEWVQNYRSVYPSSEYLAQLGKGNSAEKARTDATAALSRYFQTTVNANLSTVMSSVTTSDTVEENTIILDEVTVQSQVDFFGLEYTDPYYLISEDTWYCVVYMNRNDAWEQFRPQIEIKKNSFNGLYKNLEKETDYFSRLGMCKKVWASGVELMEKLEYGRIISPKEEAVYVNEREIFSNIPVMFEAAKENCSVFIHIETDYNRILQSSLSRALTESGFRVTKTDVDANYKAEVSVEENLKGNDPLSIKPSINLKVENKNGKTVYSYEVIASEKVVGYSLETARKKAYPKLARILEEAVKENMQAFLKL